MNSLYQYRIEGPNADAIIARVENMAKDHGVPMERSGNTFVLDDTSLVELERKAVARNLRQLLAIAPPDAIPDIKAALAKYSEIRLQ